MFPERNVDHGLNLFCGETLLLLSCQQANNSTVLHSHCQVIQRARSGESTVSSCCTIKQYPYNPVQTKDKEKLPHSYLASAQEEYFEASGKEILERKQPEHG